MLWALDARVSASCLLLPAYYCSNNLRCSVCLLGRGPDRRTAPHGADCGPRHGEQGEGISSTDKCHCDMTLLPILHTVAVAGAAPYAPRCCLLSLSDPPLAALLSGDAAIPARIICADVQRPHVTSKQYAAPGRCGGPWRRKHSAGWPWLWLVRGAVTHSAAASYGGAACVYTCMCVGLGLGSDPKPCDVIQGPHAGACMCWHTQQTALTQPHRTPSRNSSQCFLAMCSTV